MQHLQIQENLQNPQNMYNLQTLHTLQNIQNIQKLQNMQNMQDLQNLQHLKHFQNLQNRQNLQISKMCKLCKILNIYKIFIFFSKYPESVKLVKSENFATFAKSANIDLFILGGVRIIKDHMVETSKHGSINCHPGVLPWVQGSLPVCRSIIHDIPIASACHRVSSEVDKGALCDITFIDRSTCGNRFEDIISETCKVGAIQACNVVKHLAKTNVFPTFEDLSTDEGVCFNWDDDVEQEARCYLARPDYVAPIWLGPQHIPPIPV